MLLSLIFTLGLSLTSCFADPVMNLETNLDDIFRENINNKKIPGGIVVIGGQQKIHYKKFFGFKSLKPYKIPNKQNTVYDLASLTKVFTALSIAILVDEGKLKYKDPISMYLPAFGNSKEKLNTTIADILTHKSGLPAVYYTHEYSDASEQTWKRILQIPLKAENKENFVYSDVGFIILGRLISKVSAISLDQFMTQKILSPLHMQETVFTPGKFYFDRCAPTYFIKDKKSNHCVVHDPRAKNLNGVSGHAGLFSTIDDMTKLAQFFLSCDDTCQPQLISSNTFKLMTQEDDFGRGLGIDISSKYSNAIRGDLFAAGMSFGHTGFTGTSLLIERQTKSFILILTNRVHSSKTGISNLRKSIANTWAKYLTKN